MNKLSKAFRDKNLLVVLLHGFSSGLPLLLVGQTLKAWLKDSHVDLATIGFFSVVMMPYAWKVVWAPLMDRFVPPLGRRRGWLMISQIGLMVTLVGLSLIDPSKQIGLVAFWAVLVSLFSATQDIVIDAYRREVLPDNELGLGSSLYVFGYRMAMLVAGAGALYFADHMSWMIVYWIMAALMLVGVLTTLYCEEPKVQAPPPRTIKESVIEPLREFFRRDGAWSILLFVLLYKVAEGLASSLYTPFFLDIGFTKTEVAGVAKVFGVWAMIAGGIFGGTLIVKWGQYRSLWLFGILQGAAIALFSVLAVSGHNLTMLAIAIGGEFFTSGMATSAYMAFMAAQSNRRFTATQYALFTSLMGVPMAVFGSITGVMAEHLGWPLFFITCALTTIPGLLILFHMKKFIIEAEEPVSP